METKDDLIYGIASQLIRLTKKQGRIEDIPFQLDSGISVTSTEAHTLLEIEASDPINVSEIGARFGITKSAASQIVTRLSNKGLVDKKVSPHSAKELQLELTEQGQEACEGMKKHRRIHYDNIAKRLGAFSLAQIATAMAFLEVFEDIMDERLKKK